MRIYITSVFVDDQDKALKFYTEVLGFVKKTEVPLGEHRWLTVVSPQDHDGVELLLEPDSHPAVGPYREALSADGIPCASFAVDDVPKEVGGSRRSESPSPSRPSRWGRQPPPSLTTPAETSSRSPAASDE